jgi:hypothetical protein
VLFKAKFGLVLGLVLFTPFAQAGLFDIWGFQNAYAPDYSFDKEWVRNVKAIFKEVPVKSECAPQFVPGGDGVFRRIEYCHRANPQKPGGFFEMGYDVPASFLAGFSEPYIQSRWKNVRFTVPAFIGSNAEIPSELFKNLNVTAAQVWEEILKCAGGDADLGREMYRMGAFECRGEAASDAQSTKEISKRLKQTIADLHTSVLTLASSTGVEVSIDSKQLTTKILETSRMEQRLRQENSSSNSPQPDESRNQAIESLRKQRSDLIDFMFRIQSGDFVDIVELLGKIRQRLPGMHPLLVQVMLEETLSLLGPDDSTFWAARRFKKNHDQLVVLFQLLFWIGSTEDTTFSSLGLWPSANRVAIEAFGDSALEIWNSLGAPKRKSVRVFFMAACTRGLPARVSSTLGNTGISVEDMREAVLRLNDVYSDGRQTIWREVREMRERYVLSGKR